MASGIDRQRIAAGLFGTTAPSLGSYFKVYDSLIARSDAYVLQVEELDPGHPSPVRAVTHDGILIAAEILRDSPTLTLHQGSEQFNARLRATHSSQQSTLAMLVSVRAMLMLDCTGLADGWQPSERLVDFASRCFPTGTTGISAAARRAMEGKRSMKAWKLRARFGISFKGTDNLARHLFLDTTHPNGPTLYLFHYTAFLKVQLDRLQRERFHKEAGMPACLQSGCLPPRLLAETIHSIQAILFHFDDHKSSRILKRLIAKDGFDQDCIQPEGYKLLDESDMVEYRYWGERLAALHGFIRERPPRNKFERWIKWQTSDSNAFALAVAALLISIAVGILSLGLGALQIWIAWKAWKEPVSNGIDDQTTAVLHEIAELLRQRPGR